MTHADCCRPPPSALAGPPIAAGPVAVPQCRSARLSPTAVPALPHCDTPCRRRLLPPRQRSPGTSLPPSASRSARPPPAGVSRRSPVGRWRVFILRLSLRLQKRPRSSSSNACRSCSCVFMTIGPYHATGSSRGVPETRRNRIPSSPACTVSSSPRSKSTSERLAASEGGFVSAHPTPSVGTESGPEALQNLPSPPKT